MLPGQRVRGYVFLPRFDAAENLRVPAASKRGCRVTPDFAQRRQRR